MENLYPPGPVAIPDDLTAPGPAYKRQAKVALLSLLVFIVLYLSLTAWSTRDRRLIGLLLATAALGAVAVAWPATKLRACGASAAKEPKAPSTCSHKPKRSASERSAAKSSIAPVLTVPTQAMMQNGCSPFARSASMVAAICATSTR